MRALNMSLKSLSFMKRAPALCAVRAVCAIFQLPAFIGLRYGQEFNVHPPAVRAFYRHQMPFVYGQVDESLQSPDAISMKFLAEDSTKAPSCVTATLLLAGIFASIKALITGLPATCLSSNQLFSKIPTGSMFLEYRP